MPITIPATIISSKNKLTFLYRIVELLRLAHNQTSDLDIKKSFIEKIEKVYVLINNLKESNNWFRYEMNDPTFLLLKKTKEDAKTITSYDQFINLTKI